MDAPPLWPWQERAIIERAKAIAAGCRRLCLTAPTGAGKGRIIAECIADDASKGLKSVLLTNRRILIEQLSQVLTKSGIDHGIRASEYVGTERMDLSKSIQISSLQTEMARVFKSEEWKLHDADHIYCDEQHLQKEETAQMFQKRCLEKPGSVWTGITATPIALESMCDQLIIAGTKKECRDHGALVYARHFAPDEPDMRGYKQSVKTGEYTEGDVVKAIMSPNVFGRVWDHWSRLNKEQKPTILFGPSVAGSLWFAKQFAAKGIRTAHLDGEQCWLDGELYESSKRVREQMFDDFKSGYITMLTCRFLLREGVDLPFVECLIYATVMGSIQSWLQSGGRGLRASPGKSECLVIDHGGMFHRHGSLNVDRNWNLSETEQDISRERIEAFREKSAKEPIRCAKCSAVRNGGSICPECGYKSSVSSRIVVQQDGTLKEMSGDVYRPRQVSMESDTVKKWKSCYWRCRRTGRTFNQAEALFKYENGYNVPRDIPLQPLNNIDRHKRIEDVPFGRLIPSTLSESYTGSLYE